MPGLSIFKDLSAATSVILGKIRVVDSGGTEVTESTGHTLKATLQASDGVDIGNVDVATLPKITTLTHTEVTIGSSSTDVLAAAPTRVYALFQNDSDETVYLYLGATAAANKGIRLSASGGSYEITTTNLYTGVVKAICASGSKNLLVAQGV